MKPTPAPWTYRFEYGSYIIEAPSPTEPGKTRVVAQLVSLEDTKLITAAHDLLQELRNIANADTAEWDDRSEFEAWAKSRAQAAISMATGN